jgi:hypothetical protein
MRSAPPKLSDALLRLVAGREDAETISGDLEEMFHARAARAGRAAAALWHWRQVLSIAWAHAASREPEHDRPEHRRNGMTAVRQDVAYALRSLRKQPGFTATVVLMLALGIGANVAIFSLIHAALLKPLPFSQPDRLMMVHMTAPDFDDPAVTGRMVWSWPKYLVFRDAQQVYESTAAFAGWTWNVTGTDAPERAAGELSSRPTSRHSVSTRMPVGRSRPTKPGRRDPSRWPCSATASGSGATAPIGPLSAGQSG